jgi:hypothetical protein
MTEEACRVGHRCSESSEEGILDHENRALSNISVWWRLFPVLFFLTYLSFTVYLFAFGPWPYPVEDGTKLFIFLIFAHLALLVGYVSAGFGEPGGYFGRWKASRIVKLALLVNLAFLPLTMVFRTGGVVPDVTQGIINPGAAYAQFGFHNREGVPIVEYARIFFGPVLFLLFPLTLFYWQRLNTTVRVLGVLCILSTVAMYIAMGTNKGIADTVLLTPFMLLAGHLSGVSRLKWRSKAIIFIASGVAFVLFLVFFTRTQATRAGSGAKTAFSTSLNRFADLDNPIVQNRSPEVQVGLLGLSSYLGQGYYGLYLSLEKPFMPMFGVGNSMFLFRQVARITGNDRILDQPYPMRVGVYGWDGYGNWFTIYPWIASDVSFPGTILVVLVIGRLFALSWLDTLRGENPFAVAAFALFIVMLFYFPANNQVVQRGEAFASFFGILALWIVTRKRYVWRTA